MFTEEVWHGLCFSLAENERSVFCHVSNNLSRLALGGCCEVQFSPEFSANVEITAWLSELPLLPKVAKFPKWLFCLAKDFYIKVSSRGLCNFVNPKPV